jgi:hypothetical protein
MPFYDEEVRRQLDVASRAGYTGQELVRRIAAGFDLDRMTPDQRAALRIAFDRIVHPAAKGPKDESRQGKMFG